jgi:N4-gp56 family major capsid protein
MAGGIQGGGNSTSYGDISPRIGAFAAVKMLEHARPVIVLQKMGQSRPIPKNKGQIIKFRRPVPFAVATTPLTEGVAPAAQKMSYADVNATILQYGSWVELTDVIADTHEDPVLADATELCGEQAAETVELLTHGALIGGTNVDFPNGTARIQVNTKIDRPTQRRVTRILKAQRGKKITKILGPSVNISTQPVEAAYVAVTHTDVESDIRDMQGFIPVASYGTRKPICPEEIGSVEDVRYVVSPVFDPIIDAGAAKAGGGYETLSSGGTSSDIYPIIYLAQEAFGVTPLKGKEAIHPMVLNPNVPRGGDPLGQAGSVAWKTWHVATILNQAWLVRVEVAVAA